MPNSMLSLRPLSGGNCVLLGNPNLEGPLAAPCCSPWHSFGPSISSPPLLKGQSLRERSAQSISAVEGRKDRQRHTKCPLASISRVRQRIRGDVGTLLQRKFQNQSRVQSAVQSTRAGSDYVRVSSTLQTDISFPELHGVPLEQYMTETQRIFSAVFPDTHRSQRINNEVWRIFMLPINFLFLSVRPVVDMRVWVHDPAVDGLPPGSTATGGKARKMVCLEAVRCELKGLDYVLKPDDFVLGANGALYPERSGAATRMKGSMHVSISLAIPPALIFTPKGLLESAGNAVMEQVLQNMKDKVNSQLLVDYRAYAREEAAKR